MYRITSYIALALTILGFTSCSNTASEKAKLPIEAQKFIQTYFEDTKVSSIEETKTMMDFEVALENGTEISFSNLGDWEQVTFKQTDVPQSLLASLPEKISQYLHENHPNNAIKKIEKKYFGRRNLIYRVSFQKPKDLELTFSKEGEIISCDPNNTQLPSSAKSFLEKHYGNNSVTSVFNDVDGDFDVILDDKTSIDFDRKGNWFELKCSKKGEFPESVLALLPNGISKHIDKNYPGQTIRKIEKKSYGYRVRLNKPNNIELSFSGTGIPLDRDSKELDSDDTSTIE